MAIAEVSERSQAFLEDRDPFLGVFDKLPKYTNLSEVKDEFSYRMYQLAYLLGTNCLYGVYDEPLDDRMIVIDSYEMGWLETEGVLTRGAILLTERKDNLSKVPFNGQFYGVCVTLLEPNTTGPFNDLNVVCIESHIPAIEEPVSFFRIAVMTDAELNELLDKKDFAKILEYENEWWLEWEYQVARQQWVDQRGGEDFGSLTAEELRIYELSEKIDAVQAILEHDPVAQRFHVYTAATNYEGRNRRRNKRPRVREYLVIDRSRHRVIKDGIHSPFDELAEGLYGKSTNPTETYDRFFEDLRKVQGLRARLRELRSERRRLRQEVREILGQVRV